jgi:hypothetical protein
MSDDNNISIDPSIESRAELIDRFTRAEARLILDQQSPSSSSSSAMSDANPDVAFLLHALELLLSHRLTTPKSRFLALLTPAPTLWSAVTAVADMTDSIRAIVDLAKRLGVNNLARGRVLLRLALVQRCAGDLVDSVAKSSAVADLYFVDSAMRSPRLVAAVVDALGAIGARIAFRLDPVPDNVDSSDYWAIYLDDLEASRHLVAVRSQRADALLAAAKDAEDQQPAASLDAVESSLSSSSPSALPTISLDIGIDKSVVFRASENARKVRRATPRVVAVLEEAPSDATEDVPNTTTTTVESLEITSIDVASMSINNDDADDLRPSSSSPALPADVVAEFFKPVLSEDELRKQESEELDAILNRATAARSPAIVEVPIVAEPTTIVVSEPTPPVEPIDRVEPPIVSPSPSPSPPRVPTEPPESSGGVPVPTDSPSLSNSYRYAYVSSQLMGLSATRPRTNTTPESGGVLTPERRERATTTDAPFAVRDTDVVATASSDKPTLQIEIVDDYVAPEEEENDDASSSSMPRDQLADANVVEARGDVLFLERRHRPPDSQRNETCYACQRPLRFSRLVRRGGVDAAQYCFFAARYFCGNCHKNELRSIPGRIVHEFDWRLRKVSTAGASHIDRLWQSRQIDCTLVSESSCRALPTYLVQRQRFARAYVAALHACPGRASLLASDDGRVPDELLLALDDAIDDIRHEESFGASVAAAKTAIREQPGVLDHAGLTRAPTTELLRRFLQRPLSGCVFVSLAELSELQSKVPAVVRQLEASANAIEQHIARECTRCFLQGAPCGTCDVGNLFDFVDGVAQCVRCTRLFHGTESCFGSVINSGGGGEGNDNSLCRKCRL